MKRLYIVRHAKSSWADLLAKDIDRPLNSRGLRDAPRMAKYCKSHNYIPEHMITSSANRAKQTADIFQISFYEASLRLDDNLYHAPEDTYFETCFGIDNTVKSVMLFGHNPGITYLANNISSNYIDNVPTCGVLVIDSTVDSWTEIDPTNCTLIDFIYPKKI